ncbi:hypothetical protein FOIG_04282 [Fusarium odoratissimum NRRL 54006]|uniref:Uncharacterized protein n=1 Tax=Fusarium odoratissimum (strain NRRL 54006) TaxID=1089451 RepID=X0JX76_FUSO5|nr:uncharacterized protein FOIG_04282 [Fusarium odoratissimum NRRL 54006]EXM05798.1 hypothetical protein FOIG_04282 [Fusarium odoratissimum NRRL 54006]
MAANSITRKRAKQAKQCRPWSDSGEGGGETLRDNSTGIVLSIRPYWLRLHLDKLTITIDAVRLTTIFNPGQPRSQPRPANGHSNLHEHGRRVRDR